MPNYKPAFFFRDQAEPSTNAQVFATREEAAKSAEARFQTWTMPTDWTVVETEDPVNYAWSDTYGDVMVGRGVAP